MAGKVLGIFAHPDDAEFSCAGTLALLHQNGWQVHIATMTGGDGGSKKLSREEISRIRKNEAANSAKLLDGQYHCLECEDVFVVYDKPALLKVIEVIRRVQPDVVFAPSPIDYMADHEMTSKLVWAACFAAGVPNVETESKAFGKIPYLYYCDPADGKDNFGNAVKPGFFVDIGSVMDIKEKMLSYHASQRDWLLAHHGGDEYIASLKRRAQERGKEIGVKYAEAFRQHLGHAFGQENLLKSELADFLRS